MKNLLHSDYQLKNSIGRVTLLLLFSLISISLLGQVRVPFAPRTSAYTPSKTTYNIKGDFTMIGNTNLTLQDYADDENNSNNVSKYVDIDSDANTFNSSSAQLTFSTENGATPECSNIIYAGLYWTGRAGDDMTFDVTKEVATGNSTEEEVTENYQVYDNENIDNTPYSLDIWTDSYQEAIYTFSATGKPTVAFHYRRNGGASNRTLHVSVNGGTEQEIGMYWDNGAIVLDNPYTVYTDSEFSLVVNQIRSWNGIYARVSVTFWEVTQEYTTVTKTFNKRKIKFKPPGGSYVELTAASDNIYYPPAAGNDDGYMYSAYIEVTDYVQQ